MFLKKLILVNWGNIPQREFEFGPINLFSGGNGSGKTTAADAIQTLMTAAHENLFNYNPGQDETTQKGRGGKQVRTLASYVMGCDDGSYARLDTSDGYIAGVFHPTQGENASPFTAVMCMRAFLDRAGKQTQARLDNVNFLIVTDTELNLAHFVREFPDGKHITETAHIAGLLKKEFGSNLVEVYDKKGVYLNRLYGVLRGKKEAVPAREAKHAARTFSNFMAYKPVKSISEFVAREVLEPRDLGDAIRNVSELMKTIHQMEADAKTIRGAIETLSNAESYTKRYVDTWIEGNVLQYTDASRSLFLKQKAYRDTKRLQSQIKSDFDENSEKLTICNERQRQLYDQRVALEAKRQGINALKTKDDLEQSVEQFSRELGERAKPLLVQHQQMVKNTEATQKLVEALSKSSLAVHIPELEDKHFRQAAKKVLENENTIDIDISRMLSKDWVGIEQIEQQLDSFIAFEANLQKWTELLHKEEGSGKKSIRDQIAIQVSLNDQKYQAMLGRRGQKEKEILRLKNHKANYPVYVENALNAIRKQCPEANPQVLCDFIEVTDPQWQMAIEGYIGGARFSILVDEEYEADAIRIVRSLSDARRNNARVIQGGKAKRDADRLTHADNSLVSVLEFSHKTAEYYIRASYGNVLLVEDAESLKKTARGLTTEGLGAGNYSMWRCDLDDSELVFGQGARQRAMQAKRDELDRLLIEQNAFETSVQQVHTIFQLVDGIKPVACAELLQDICRIQRKITHAENELARLDLSDFKSLEDELEKIKQQSQELEAQSSELQQQIGVATEKNRQIDKKIREQVDSIEELQAEQERLEERIRKIGKLYPDFDDETALQAADTQAGQASADFDFTDQLKTLAQSLEEIERKLYQVVTEHNQNAQQHNQIVYSMGIGERHGDEFFLGVVALGGELVRLLNTLKNNVLVNKYGQLEKLKESFNTAFVTNLCHSIYQAICQGKRVLEELNQELESHRFGADRERFYFGWDWMPEYKEYWRFFKTIIDMPNLGDGTSLFDAGLPKEACKIRDKLFEMLLSQDEQVALRELTRISDYRNYRQYEIYKEPEGKAPIALSQYGTGSGGQLETPAYIIRSAAVTSAFRFNEGSNHLRMVLVDEAFSKMDETRSREVIHYLTETLGLQLIFIMPTSKSGPFMDLISNQFVFAKLPSPTPVGELKTCVLVDRKVCNQEKIKALWANHRKAIRSQASLDFMETVLE
ncbi:ATP-binding protein [Teredinibacter sp. KSP-S5-2]|uniref:ATP-binding protein n=1 Tax=Teredinibacter sp. KSP-S5-2 TaxID=3034506 RepID=UPI002934DBE4|nr:SbcC/MukB-like Walker B domain-containing protein [Teredinibacter sp. KSP-S5-2]WNO10828.1 SbcC/MukB-like Walker B domain-containing protein [Teredinibacter sp. KSP-S5-2]